MPPVELPLKLTVLPSFTGELFVAVMFVGGVQVGVTVTDVVAVAEHVPLENTVKVYVPDMAVVAPALVGF